MKDKEDKYHVRTLEEVDKQGNILSIHIVYDFDAMLRDYFPELKDQENTKKKKGDLLPFPK